MATVGDVILGFRELATDLPSTMPAPSISSITLQAGGFPTGTFYFVATLLTNWGETDISNEVQVAVPAFQAPVINYTLDGSSSGVTPPAGVTGMRFYYGTASGQQTQYFEITAAQITGQFIPPTAPFTIAVQAPPDRNTAYLPDSNGQAVSAPAAYRWFNEGMRAAANFNGGGIPDFGAVGTVSGQPLYVLTGFWKKLDTGWYDGYPLYLARKNDVFRRSPVTGTIGALLVQQASDRLIVEVWPQPSRTSCQTTLSAPITATATSCTVANASSWVLGFGKMQIGSEVIEYAAHSGNNFTGLTRGMGGTVPAAHSAGEAVTELNLEISGYRVPSTYSLGSSASTLNLPPGWEDAIKDYMVSRFRGAEQDGKEEARLLKQFNEKMQSLRSNRIIAGPRQIQANAGRGAETMVGLGSLFGGVIVP